MGGIFEDERGMRHPLDREISHSGKGPRGYRRRDQRIRDDVCELLTQHPGIDPSDIEVSVSEGIVTLEGVVNHRQDRRLILETVEDVPGVEAIHNHISVRKHVNGWIPQIALEDNDRDQGMSDFIKGLY